MYRKKIKKIKKTISWRVAKS